MRAVVCGFSLLDPPVVWHDIASGIKHFQPGCCPCCDMSASKRIEDEVSLSGDPFQDVL